METETIPPSYVTLKSYRDYFGELPHRDNPRVDWTNYCARGMALPPCETCPMSRYGRDCHNNGLDETAPRE